MNEDRLLRLAALDGEDLDVISAHLQDALVKVSDISWEPGAKRLLLVLNRFAWEVEPAGPNRARTWERRRTVLQFDRIEAVRTLNINRDQGDDVLELLAIRFEESEPPSGTVHLIFAGNAELKFDVEVLEARLADMGPAWTTTSLPRHNLR